MGKGIRRIYKHSQSNWTYPPPNTTSVIPQHTDPSKQTKSTSSFDVTVDSHDLASSVSYQSTSKHVNTDFNDDYYPQSFETLMKNNHISNSLVDTYNTTTTPFPLKDHIFSYQHNTYKIPNFNNLLPPVNEYICFQMGG